MFMILRYEAPKGSPFLKCVVSMGFARIPLDPPPSAKQAPWSTFFRPYFFHLFFDIAKIKEIKKGLPLRTEQFKNAF